MLFGKKKKVQKMLLDELMVQQRLERYRDCNYNEQDRIWLERMAICDVAAAQYAIGTYELIYGDSNKALPWYTKAALQDYDKAELAIGLIYEEKGDYAEAAGWFYKAAEHGRLDDAQYYLGKCYLYGMGVPKDVEQGISLLADVGDNKRHVEARYLLGCYYLERQSNADDLMKAEYWLGPIMDESVNAKTKMGVIYLNPKHKLYNPNFGVMFLREAAAAGDKEAIALLRSIGA